MKRKFKTLSCLIISASAIILFTVASTSAADAYEQSGNTAQGYVIFTENNIKTEDMRKKSELDKEELSEYLEKFPNLSGIEDALISAQDDYSVNAILILAIVRLESGNGGSRLAKSKNNLGGLVSSGRTVTVYKTFDTKSDCVTYMAQLLSENYLTEGGKYYNGYTLNDIAKSYSTSSKTWSDLVTSLIYEIQTEISTL
ncbi:MAG: glucosaminidase domain-containing protein [Oscillospiraceae bacterium]|nr:glucosaminidase domain-containing protein [Oscillospiraceae bacterium]